ncbi:MAG TPA: tetratricopeptide repeat protein [Candidatus Hydrogenedens sp.]|nr:tetratricopeptide repeat protein [Candidatus Hydrogenedens sp.]
MSRVIQYFLKIVGGIFLSGHAKSMSQGFDFNSNSPVLNKEKVRVWSKLKMVISNLHFSSFAWNILLVALIIIVFGQAINFDFIYYDDVTYTLGKVNRGNVWSFQFLSWAIKSTDDGFWAPITKISHRIDTHLFGNNATGHHVINLLLHIINSLLLWRLLCRLTGEGFIQFLAMCIFAIHPLRVEPVAWIASRKDLLSTLFLFLMLLKYIDWAKTHKKWDYILSLLFFVFAAMSKPVSIVFPLCLPVLDIFFLSNDKSEWKRINLIQKTSLYIPYFVISILLALITLQAEQEAIIPVSLPVIEKISRIIVATALYFLLSFIPINLHVPYGIEYFPFFGWTQGIPVYRKMDILISSLFILIIVSAFWLLSTRDRKRSIGSLLIFLIPLLPVIGFIPFGHHLIADRFTYPAHIGLSLFICFLLLKPRVNITKFLNLFIICVIVVYSFLSFSYARLWGSGERLFRNTLKYEPNNYVALCNLGYSLILQNRFAESISCLQKAIEVYPLRAGPYNDLAFAYQSLGRYQEAISYYNKSLELEKNDPEILTNIAVLYLELSDYKTAEEYALKAYRIDPNTVNARKVLDIIKNKENANSEN